MAISTMYTAMPGSPETALAVDITADATSMTVADGNALPAAPNIAVIGDESNAEVVIYNQKSGNTLSGLIRGLGGTTASAWTTGTSVARNYTSFDHNRFKENIEDLATNKADAADVYTQTEIDTLLNGKQNTLTFDSTPTASSTNPVTSGGVKSALNTLDDSKVNKSGDTMTGSLQIKSSAIDSSNTNPPSSNQHFVGLGIYDKSNKYIGYLQAMRNTNGNNYLQIAARRIVNSQNKEASLSLSVDAEGNASCTLPKIISGTWEGSTINVAHGGTGKTTHTANAVLTGNGTSAVNNVATASGAFYATKANGAPSFGTLPVAQGGTGVATLTSGAALIGNGTNDITTRSITNNTSKNYITANTNLITANTLGYWNGAYNSSGSSNISYLGTISKGTWQGSAIGLNYGGTGGTDSGWQPYENSDKFIGTIYYRKVGVFFEIQAQLINLKNTLTAGGSVLLMTVPSTYRPSKEIMPSCFINNSSVQNRVAPMRLAYNGQLYLYANKTDAIDSSYNLYFSGFGM